jgi:8-oxo-dGTP pyrophosphatase MutT (NUDIX family)
MEFGRRSGAADEVSLRHLRRRANTMEFSLAKDLIKYSQETECSVQKEVAQTMLSFLQTCPCPFHRETEVGHFTAGAFVLNFTRTHVLLMHHVKLDKWLIPGGHCDGRADTALVARQELLEETGLKCISLVSSSPFDLDIHRIPKHQETPEHLHYDLRYVFVSGDVGVDSNLPLLKANHESKGLEWVELERVQEYTVEESILRMVKRVKSLCLSESPDSKLELGLADREFFSPKVP